MGGSDRADSTGILYDNTFLKCVQDRRAGTVHGGRRIFRCGEAACDTGGCADVCRVRRMVCGRIFLRAHEDERR